MDNSNDVAEQPQTMPRAQEDSGQQTQQPDQGRHSQPARWDPFALFEELQEEMARLWGQPPGLWPMMRPLRRFAQLPTPTTFAPRVDVFEKDGTLVVKAELPGIKKEDVRVELEGSNLVIRGESKGEHEIKQENFYRMERSAGSFYRRLPLPFEAQPDQVRASMSDGVLEVRIPRPVEQTPEATRIPVK